LVVRYVNIFTVEGLTALLDLPTPTHLETKTKVGEPRIHVSQYNERKTKTDYAVGGTMAHGGLWRNSIAFLHHLRAYLYYQN